jgi:hypothetical protein
MLPDEDASSSSVLLQHKMIQQTSYERETLLSYIREIDNVSAKDNDK